MLNRNPHPDSISTTFSEIFEEILSTTESSSFNFSAGWESHLEPSGIGHIIKILSEKPSALGFSEAPKMKVRSAYIGPSIQIKSKPKPVTSRLSHTLNEIQKEALTTLRAYSQGIEDNFNLNELKSAYRLAAFKTHPDQGGNSESFQVVKKSYQILLALVKS